MSYFTQAFIDFFQELSEHNQREWFHENKKRYERHVKQPFAAFVQALIDEIGQHEPLYATPKECIFRINRDIRFSKDKTPYKVFCSANIANGGRKNPNASFYIQFSYNQVMIGGGIYAPDKTQLYKIRQHIQYNLEAFEQLLEEASFKKLYGQIQGEKNKRVPKEFKEDAALQPYIANKQFYYLAEYQEEATKLLLSENLLKEVLTHYEAALPMNTFLNEAIEE